MIRDVILYHAVITLVFILIGKIYFSLAHVLGFGIGSATSAANLVALIWVWRQIFLKKLIALAVGVIVFKYAILGLIVYFVVASEKTEALGFAMGIASIVPTVMIIAKKHWMKQP